MSRAERNPGTAEALDALWMKLYGLTRTECVECCLADVPRDAKVLEVGTSSGAQLSVLGGLGFGDTYGVDLCGMSANPRPCAKADAIFLPFADDAFDVVMCSGMLIHIPPGHLRREAISEMLRVSSRWVMVTEYRHESRVYMYYFEDHM